LAAPFSGASGLTCEQFLDQATPPLTNSTKYQALESNTADRTQWIEAQNRSLNTDLKKSPNTQKIGDWLRTVFDRPRTNKVVALDDGTKIFLRTRGLGKAQELVWKVGSTEQILWSSFAEKKNGSVHFVNFSVSPDQRYVALVSEQNGSLDKFNTAIYDLKSRIHLRLPGIDLSSLDSYHYWLNNEIYFRQDDGMKKLDVSNPSLGVVSTTQEVLAQQDGFALVFNGQFQLLSSTGAFNWADGSRPEAILGKDATSLYLKVAAADGKIEIRRLSLPLTAESVPGTPFITFKGTVVRSASFYSGHFFVGDSWGPRQSLTVYDSKGLVKFHFNAPEGTSISAADFNPEKTGLSVTLTSPVTASKTYNFDHASQAFSVPKDQIISEMMTMNGKVYESFFVETASADGTKIPLRITKLKDLPKDGTAPVFMNIYGGFKLTNGFYPSYDPLTADFLSRGGILADPAVRGGNEFGPAWSTVASQHNKVKTLEDVIAVSQYMVAQSYTQPRRVIISGTSNGGMVVAATALHSPKDFGLVIAVNGVQDLLRKEVMDAKFENGWASEYGDSRKPEDYPFLYAISPVEQSTMAKESPKFLILQGRNDSRVNPGHSFKLDATLNEADPNEVRMTSINNSGHWMASPDYQGWIGWRTLVVQWTTIYDFLGWHR
jgi:prolyl oligopeptidase PreP (S9A serine peptidase family)